MSRSNSQTPPLETGPADRPTANQARALRLPLLQKDKREDAQENYAGDKAIRHAVSHAHDVRRIDDFRHVQTLSIKRCGGT
jgi:hypothetical protein